MPEEIWFYLTIILGVTTVALVVLFLIERERKKYPEGEAKQARSTTVSESFLSTSKSISDEVAREVKGRLRVLDLEREILSYAIRRLYEAQAEGKITPEERDTLAKKYREDLERVKEEIARGETIMALNELERMREEFIKMFSEKLEIIDKRIEELKAIVSLKPTEHVAKPLSEGVKVEETERQTPTREEQAEKQSVQRKRRETTKSRAPEGAESKNEEEPEKTVEGDEADKSIEKIVAEIERVLSRLSQIEAEE